MERQFNACQTACTMYLSIFNSFHVIRCLSQCLSPKISILPHFCFPWGRPWGNHAKCCMDRKIIRCLQIASLHVPFNYNLFWDRARYWSKIVIFSYPLAFDALVTGGSRQNIATPFGIGKTRMVWLPDGEKISRICLFVLTWSTNVTDRQTDGHRMPAYTALMHSIAR